ncbi:hypothetical protein GobsT_67950 [Gemmata obscuriglobus]|nr:hypothetical protein GobsT_67950 [Gemmata obscuriglobus]VTS11297.1 unnamed protein product [Gemmata obscuriglobus UQM 2246]
MSRSGWLILALACAAGAALGAAPRPPVGAAVRGALDATPADDPFPIRRVRAPAAKLPELLKEFEPGPVLRLPRSEFEARVRAAGRAVARAKHAPRIVEANYTAAIDGGDLVGTATLGVLNATGGAAFLSLDPLRVAVRSPRWGADGAAVLAVPAGAAAPAVWVTREGRQALQFRWSLAGTAEPGERRFDLKVPTCASAALDLELLDDQVPAPLTDALLTGPFAAEGKPGRKRWRFQFGGRPRLEFAVRATAAASAGATAALVAKYELSPHQLTAAFEYELRPVRGSVGEWTLLADPGLRVTEVIANNGAGWSVGPPAAPGGPRRVTVSLRQPGPGGKVLVTAVAPLPDAARHADAPLPAVRPLGAVTESESVELRVAPGLNIGSWAPGDYHLTDAVTATDLSRVLSLSGALMAPGSNAPFRRMPSIRLTNPESAFNTFERLEWFPGPAASLLVARVGVRATRGALFQLTVRPPPGFALDRGAAGTDELVAHIGPPWADGQVIELARPLLAGQQAELRFEFRGPGARPGTPVPFPTFAVAGATERDGWLSVSVAPAWVPQLRPDAGATPAGLWGWLATDAPADARAVYTYRAKEPAGTLVLAPAAPVLRADAVVSLGTADGRWLATTRVSLSAAGGALTEALVFVPGPPDDGRTWGLTGPAENAASAIPIPPALIEPPFLGTIDGLANLVGAPARVGAGGAGTFWLVRFARPVAGAAVLETVAPGPPLGTDDFVLGVPRLVGADQNTRVELAAALRGRATAELKGAELRVRPAPVAAGLQATGAYLLTAVRGPDEIVAAFGATVRDSGGGTLPVELPHRAEVRGVCVNGRWLSPAACAVRGGALSVPIPVGDAVRFEVRYRLPAEPGWPTRTVTSPVPLVPGDPPVRRWWSFADGVLPGWPARPDGAVADGPPLLGGPITSGPPALVIRSDDGWVRVGAVRTADAVAAVAAAVVVALGVVGAGRARGALVFGAVAAAALGAAEFGSPWWARIAWPVLCAAPVGFARALVWAAARRAVAAGILVGTLALGSFGLIAQPPVPVTVFIGTGAGGAEEVTAANALLERLDALAHPAPLPPVVTAVTYDVRADDTGAWVAARFVVHAFRPGDNVLTLPLGDARLERVTVNGAPAFATAPKPDTYAVPLGAAGRYEIDIRFAATVTASGAERELRFGTPDVPDTKLTAVLPGAARQPQSVGRLGRQTTATAGERTTIEADLGAVKHVHLRWREGVDGAAAIKVREACVWDVTDGGAELTAAYLVRVEQGTVPGLRVDVPAELEVLRVAVRAPDALGTAPALRDWQLEPEKGGVRPLQIDFQGASAGRFLVVLECAPRKPLTRQPVLRFPRVVFGSVKGETDPVYALRPTRVAVEEVGRTGVIDFSADALRDFVPVTDLKLDPNQLPRAFRPAPGAAAELRPVLRTGEAPRVLSSTAWAVGPTRADANGHLSWSSEAPVALFEFSVPAVQVLEVRGPDVSGWGRSGERVQVWLRAGAREGAFEWTGTLDPGGRPGAEWPFEPAVPAVPNGRLTSVDVRVRPAPGWTARPATGRGWSPARADELRYHAAGPPAPGLRVQLVPLPPGR